jgi:Holliday junction resolvasome RuvABC ATP-dependent DNA helicase subunit
MSDRNPLIDADISAEDADSTLRPQTLNDFVGQAAARANLKVFIEERPRLRRSWPKNLALISARPLVR